jgi:hypothetical protein
LFHDHAKSVVTIRDAERSITAKGIIPAGSREPAFSFARNHTLAGALRTFFIDPESSERNIIILYNYRQTVEDGELVEFDRFCHAEHKANQPFVSTFDDAATQAIEPRTAVVDVFQEDGNWKIWRPATPTLIGIDGDPDLPLSVDPHDPLINDDDGDGKPGVTVGLTLYGFLEAELYIARSEIFRNDLTLYSNGNLPASLGLGLLAH